MTLVAICSVVLDLVFVCSLFKKVDVDRVLCWNEAEDGMGKTVLKPWEDRLDKDKVCSQKFDVLVQSLDSKSVHKGFKANVQLGL